MNSKANDGNQYHTACRTAYRVEHTVRAPRKRGRDLVFEILKLYQSSFVKPIVREGSVA